MSATLRPVLLSGGAGTRLWPLSTPATPKQFLELLGAPLFVATLERLHGLETLKPVTVVSGGDHVSTVQAAVEGSGLELGALIVEPVGRDTAPAVVAAALVADSDDTLIVLPSDHRITDRDGFQEAVVVAADLAEQGHLVTFGVKVDRAETGYGYIEVGVPVGGGFSVARFKEKPDASEAAEMASSGSHLWNSGMFVFRADVILSEAQAHVPDLVELVARSLPVERTGVVRLGGEFLDVTPISLDHAVMEKTDRAVVVPIDVGWSDVGSWQSLWEACEQDDDGNVLVGEVTALGVTNSYVHSTSKKVAVAGLDGVVVVETDEAILVLPVSQSQLVRELARMSDRGGSPD